MKMLVKIFISAYDFNDTPSEEALRTASTPTSSSKGRLESMELDMTDYDGYAVSDLSTQRPANMTWENRRKARHLILRYTRRNQRSGNTRRCVGDHEDSGHLDYNIPFTG